METATGDRLSANSDDPPEYTEEVPTLELRYDNAVYFGSPFGKYAKNFLS
jgi:hypothetical protein